MEREPLGLTEAATALRTANNCGGADILDKEPFI